MQLFVCCILFIIVSVRCLYASGLQVEKFSANGNREAIECLESLISVRRYWGIHDFCVIFDRVDFVDANFFQRFPNIRWQLHSVKNDNLTGLWNVIFFTSDFDSFLETSSVVNFQKIDHRAKFVISVAKNFASLDEIKIASVGIPAAMWNLDKVNVVYLVPCNEDIFAMTYFPFARNCQVGDLEVLDVWKEKDFVKGVELFPEKMLDIRGCVQEHIVAFPEITSLLLREEITETGKTIIGGVGGRLITLVANKMNMKLHAVPEPLEYWRQFPYRVAEGKSLFLVSATISIPGVSDLVDLGNGYQEESFGLGYNVGGFEVSWRNVIWPLSSEVWQWIGFTGLLFFGILVMTNLCKRGEIIPDKLRILDGFGIFLGTSRALPWSYFGRCLFGMWMVYSYLINVAYTSGLTSFLTHPNEKSIINTFEELLDDGQEFGGGAFHREFYHDPSDPVMMKIYNNFKIWSDDEGLDYVVAGKGVTGFTRSYVYLHNSNFTGKLTGQVRMLKDKAFTYSVPIVMRRGSPFLLGVRRYTSQAIQGGFHEYWLKYYIRNSSFASIRTNTPVQISLQHIKGILYVHTVLLTFSCIVFLGEIIFYKYLQTNGSLNPKIRSRFPRHCR